MWTNYSRVSTPFKLSAISGVIGVQSIKQHSERIFGLAFVVDSRRLLQTDCQERDETSRIRRVVCLSTGVVQFGHLVPSPARFRSSVWCCRSRNRRGHACGADSAFTPTVIVAFVKSTGSDPTCASSQLLKQATRRRNYNSSTVWDMHCPG